MTIIIIRKSIGGWKVFQSKVTGIDKGEKTLATFCGGMLGKTLAGLCAKEAASITMADAIEIEE